MLKQRLENYGVLLAFCVLAFFSVYQLSSRGFLFADELINTAVTYRSAGNFAGNYLDFSLRPLYRVFNQMAVGLFGTAVNSLWLASALFLTASTIGIIALARPFLTGATLATIPLLVLVYPYYGSFGLSAMPHATSSVYAAIAILLALPVLKAVLNNVETGTEARYAVLSGVFLALTLFAHPGQIAAVAAILLVVGIVGLVPVASRRWKAALARSIRLLGPGLLAFCACIAAMDIAYRILTGGVPSDRRILAPGAPSERLLDGWTYSYVNLWFGNAAFIDSDLTQYTKPFSFYFLILWNSFAAFTVATVAVILIAVGVLAVNVRRGAWKQSDLIYFVPAASLLLWLVFTSLMSFAANRILSGATMIYPLALAFLLEYLIRQKSVSIRLRWLVTAAVGGVAIYTAVADLGPRKKRFSR